MKRRRLRRAAKPSPPIPVTDPAAPIQDAEEGPRPVAYHPKRGDAVIITGTVQEIAADTAIVALDRGGLAAVPWDACVPPGWTLTVRDAMTGEPVPGGAVKLEPQPGVVALVELVRS